MNSSLSENAKPTGYVRGHLSPYFVMGGDRDGDGSFAAANQNAGAAEDDHDDALTVFQANYTTNIAPQHHNAFNGSGGMWYALEDWVRRSVRTGNRELWVIAGCVFGEGPPEMVGPDEDIAVPPAFFKIVVLEQQANQSPVVLAFLFPHHRARHGDIDDYLVAVDVIEALTGLNFFSSMTEDQQRGLERPDSYENWAGLFGD